MSDILEELASLDIVHPSKRLDMLIRALRKHFAERAAPPPPGSVEDWAHDARNALDVVTKRAVEAERQVAEMLIGNGSSVTGQAYASMVAERDAAIATANAETVKLVKAENLYTETHARLRVHWEAQDIARDVMQSPEGESLLAAIKRVVDERDDAVAEVERLKSRWVGPARVESHWVGRTGTYAEGFKEGFEAGRAASQSEVVQLQIETEQALREHGRCGNYAVAASCLSRAEGLELATARIGRLTPPKPEGG